MKAKPQPPPDLWAQLEKAVQEVTNPAPKPKPPNAFTSQEFITKFKLSDDQARGRIRKLMKAGKAKRVGGPSRFGYYVLL